jgi:hypothetical protein
MKNENSENQGHGARGGLPSLQANEVSALFARVVASEWDEGCAPDGGGYWLQLRDGYLLDGASVVHEWTREACIARLPEVRRAATVRDGITFTPDDGASLRDALAVCRARRVVEREQQSAATICAAVAGNDAVEVAAHLWKMSDAFAASFVRKWEAGFENGRGRSLDQIDVDEIQAIYHAAFVSAFARCGIAPANKRELYRAKANTLPFRALLTWHRQFKAASTQIRSYLWGRGAELCQIESLATPSQLWAMVRELSKGNAGGLHVSGVSEPARAPWEQCASVAEPDTVNDLGDIARGRVGKFYQSVSPVPLARVRCELRHARWCLRAFWTVNDSRKWRAGFAGDNALLRAITLAARGYGLSALASLGLMSNDGRAASDALRKALQRLRERLAEGDKLLTDAPERVAAAYLRALGDKPAARRLVADILPDARVERLAAVNA